jgi:hypothetical protein
VNDAAAAAVTQCSSYDINYPFEIMTKTTAVLLLSCNLEHGWHRTDYELIVLLYNSSISMAQSHPTGITAYVYRWCYTLTYCKFVIHIYSLK